MKQPGVIFIFVVFLAGVGFVLARQEYAPELTARLTSMPTSTENSDHQIALRSNFSRSQLCYELMPQTSADFSELKVRSVSSEGPTFIDLTSSKASGPTQCVTVERSKLAEIVQNPDNYFVTVNSPTLGRLAGQLNQK